MSYEEAAKEAITGTGKQVTLEEMKVSMILSIAYSLLSINEKLGQIKLELNEFNRMNKK